jgi:DNA-binding CsgD family transcriptional regulator
VVLKKADRSTGLLERDAELKAIGQFLTRARVGPGVLLVIQGAPGVGKTALVEAAAQRAQAGGTLVLRAAGSELEQELGFGVVRALLEKSVAQVSVARRRRLLAGAASLAAPVVLPTKAAQPADPAAVLHGLFWLVANLADSNPLMLVVDDAHWADHPSLRFMAYLARRLNDLPVLLVVATRPAEPSIQGELASLLTADPPPEVMTPAPLSQAAVGHLIAERLSVGPAPEFVAASHAATGGNAFLVGELITALSSDGVAATSANAKRVSQIGPQTVSTAVLARVSRVGAEARALTEAVAVLGGAELGQYAALADLGRKGAAQAADALAQIGVLSPTRPLQFVHPLVQAAVYEAIPPGRRSLMHGTAARLLAEQGVGADRVTLQLLHTEPVADPWVVTALRSAAAAAMARGAPDQAAGYLHRALREPPVPSERAPTLHELGAAELLAGEASATSHLLQALDGSEDPSARGEIALLLGRAAVSTGRLADTRQLLEPVIEQLREGQAGIAARLEAYRSAGGVWDPRFAVELQRDMPRLRALAETAGSAGRSLQLMLAFRSAFEGGRPADIAALIERGLDQGRLIESETAEATEITWAVRALTFIDELDRADHVIKEMVADARKRGSVVSYAIATAWRADVALHRGLLSVAEAEARSALEFVAQHGIHFIAPHAHSFLGEALIEQGEVEEAIVMLERAELGPMQGSRPEIRFLHTRARARLAHGQRQAAIEDLRICQAQASWFRNPNVLAWRSTLALALPTRSEAADLVNDELQLARKIGQPRAIGVALRVLGLLSKGEEQISLLSEAVSSLESCPSQLELARALTDLGAALRRASRRSQARELLTRALDLAASCRATSLAARARQELVAAGARPRRERLTGPEALTASEGRVADMARAGMSNREIAQELFVTMKAVALHLTHVYEKLQIDGRAQLPGALVGSD